MDIELLEREMPKKVKVVDAAEMMGLSPTKLREALKQGLFPLGVAIILKQTEVILIQEGSSLIWKLKIYKVDLG